MATTNMTAIALPSGVSAPLTAINSKDKSGLVAIIAGFELGLVLLAIAVKACTRNYFRHLRYDDIMFCLAVVRQFMCNNEKI